MEALILKSLAFSGWNRERTSGACVEETATKSEGGISKCIWVGGVKITINTTSCYTLRTDIITRYMVHLFLYIMG